MVHGISSGSPIPSDRHATDYQTIQDWIYQLNQLAQIRGLNCTPYIDSIINELQNNLNGDPSKVLAYIKQTFFDPHDNSDLYMRSAVSSDDVEKHDIINKITEVFGLQAPPPTDIDLRKMSLMTEAHDDPNFPFFDAMDAEFDKLGSNGSINDLMKWANNFVTKNQNDYNETDPKYQEMFWHILNF